MQVPRRWGYAAEDNGEVRRAEQISRSPRCKHDAAGCRVERREHVSGQPRTEHEPQRYGVARAERIDDDA